MMVEALPGGNLLALNMPGVKKPVCNLHASAIKMSGLPVNLRGKRGPKVGTATIKSPTVSTDIVPNGTKGTETKMAQNMPQQTTPQKTAPPITNVTAVGRPALPKGGDKTEVALKRLQYTVDRACNFIHDGGSSYANRARKAARAGVPKERALKGVEAMRAALIDAEKAIERAYSQPEKRPVAASRVSL